MPRLRALLLASILAPLSASATPISVAGFTFAAGEAAFADDVIHVSGPVLDPNTVRRVLTGSDISDSFNTGDSNATVLEVIFLNNSIVNGPGVDLVIFELSGDKPAGSPDPKEIFDVSVFNGSGFSPFVTVTPIATGFNNPADSSLDVFVVQIDLNNFGIPIGLAIDRIRLGVYNSNQGSKSADLTAVGALNSGAPIPEPSTALLVGGGLLAIAATRRRSRRGKGIRSTLILALAGLLAAGTAFADPPELIPVEIPEARLFISATNSSGGCYLASRHPPILLANGESAVVEGECPPGRAISVEVTLIDNAVIVTLPTGFDSASVNGDLLSISVPNLAPTMPLVFGSEAPSPGARTLVLAQGEIGGRYAIDNSAPVNPRQTVPVLGGDTVNAEFEFSAWGGVSNGQFRFEVSTAAPPPSAITRKEFDDLQRRLSVIESLPGIARRLARVPGLELAFLLVPGAWLYHRRAGLRPKQRS